MSARSRRGRSRAGSQPDPRSVAGAGGRPSIDNPRMTRLPPGEQLPLEFAPTGSRLPERITPMRPTDGEGPFDDAGYFFEPWWPGIRALVLVEGGNVRLRAEALGDPTAAFPELAGVARLVRGDGVVMDATLMVLDARGRPSRTLLERRLRGGIDGSAAAGGSGTAGGSAALVASDLLYPRGGEPRGAPVRRAPRRAGGAPCAVALVPRRPRVRG